MWIPTRRNYIYKILHNTDDSVYKNDKSHYPKVLEEDCKYIVKDNTIKKYTTFDLFDSDSDWDSSFKSIKK